LLQFRVRCLSYCVAPQRCRDRASGTESLKSLLALCIVAPQRYCYAYGTLTGTATLMRRHNQRFGAGAVS